MLWRYPNERITMVSAHSPKVAKVLVSKNIRMHCHQKMETIKYTSDRDFELAKI